MPVAIGDWDFHSLNTFRLVFAFHIIGIVVLGGRMLGMFVEDIRARTAKDPKDMIESLRHRWIIGMAGGPFGSVLVLGTGILLVFVRDYSFAEGWILTNLSIAGFELTEGMLFTRRHLSKTASLTERALTDKGAMVELKGLMAMPIPKLIFRIKPITFLTMMVMSIYRPF